MTVLSLFVPLVATVCAFWFLGDDPSYVADKDDSWKAALTPRNLLESWRVLAGGIFLGLTSESAFDHADNSRSHALLGVIPIAQL